jgi:hypothetical protein
VKFRVRFWILCVRLIRPLNSVSFPAIVGAPSIVTPLVFYTAVHVFSWFHTRLSFPIITHCKPLGLTTSLTTPADSVMSRMTIDN